MTDRDRVMTTPWPFEPGFVEWIAGADYAVFDEQPGVAVVAKAHGEIRYEPRVTDDGFTLLRAERADEPEAVFRASEFVQIEKYLSAQIGIDLRSLRRLPMIRFPIDPKMTADGFSLVPVHGGWEELRHAASGRTAGVQFPSSFIHPAVEYSYYADADPAAIRRSFTSSSGAPLFTRFVTPDG